MALPIVGVALIVASAGIYLRERFGSGSSSFGWAASTPDIIEAGWQIAFWTTAGAFGTGALGLALIAFWIGRRVGARA